MQAAPFSRWWKDPIKHYKRRYYWIPQAKKLHRELNGERNLRYFTLCSLEMIDVFCLIKEKVVSYDSALHKINHVTFCESESAIYPEIKEMIGYEDSGFLGQLENIVLFNDDRYTAKFTSQGDIDIELGRLGEEISRDRKDSLELKLEHLRFQQAFPFDFINLDFCETYYPIPDTMKINATVERLVDWQGRLIVEGGSDFALRKFLLAITCRFDDGVSKDAFDRMETVLKGNQKDYPQYRITIERNPTRKHLRQWRRNEPLDYFLCAWPKELLHIMERYQWKMDIRALVFYPREGESGKKYIMVSLLCDCLRQHSIGTHEAQSLWLLDKANREELKLLPPSSPAGRALNNHFKSVVALRNTQAKRLSRTLLS